MSIEALNWCKHQDCPTPTSKLVLFVLSNYADEEHSCFPSEKLLGKICGISDRQVRTHLRALEAHGLLQVISRIGTSNRYILSVEAHFQRGPEADFRRARKRTSANTKLKQNNQRGRMNELAG